MQTHRLSCTSISLSFRSKGSFGLFWNVFALAALDCQVIFNLRWYSETRKGFGLIWFFADFDKKSIMSIDAITIYSCRVGAQLQVCECECEYNRKRALTLRVLSALFESLSLFLPFSLFLALSYHFSFSSSSSSSSVSFTMLIEDRQRVALNSRPLILSFLFSLS